jgi:hypothetical protein
MQLHLQLKHYLHYVAFFILPFFFIESKGQTHTQRHVSMVGNSLGYWEYLPQNYNSEPDTYPLIIFITGIGELGDGGVDQLPKVLANGTPKTIKDGTFPVSVKVNGETFKFLVISPQFLTWPSTSDVQGVIDYAVRNYRVNTSRIYLTGLSMGGGAIWDYVGATAANANRIAAIVPVCGASGPENDRISVLTNAALPIWATHNIGDDVVPSANTIGYIDKIAALNFQLNPSSPLNRNPIAKKTIFPVDGHDAWSTTYSLDFKENGKNIYEWMLQYTRGNSPGTPSQNQPPIANAGSDQTITLPTNSVILSGSGTDPDGNIANYSWSKISGPNQFSINSANIYNPTISNLIEGTYKFQLIVTDNKGATASDDINIIVNSAPVAPPISNAGNVIPGKIEAENYNNMFGIRTELTADEGGGQNVGWIDYGDWMDYNVNVSTSGNYTVNLRVATVYAGQQLQIKTSDGSVLTTVNIPQTGGYQTWRTVSTLVSLKAGTQTLRISSVQNGIWNINWAEFIANPENGIPGYATIPGKIEAENYSSMYGVLTEPTQDVNGGLNVGWIELNDWFDYNVNVASAGIYTVNFRVATPFAGEQFQLKSSDGSILTTVNVPQTGSFQTWKTVSANISLKAGTQTIRVYSSKDGWWNLNWLEFVSNSSSTLPGYALIPGKIEAETYSSMFGVMSESTTDEGGGSNLGWIENGDWMEYKVSVAASGNYDVNFRVASPYAGQKLQVKNSNGTVLATLNIPKTGGFQIWQTAGVSLYLLAGNQTIRIVSTQNGWWNINWMDFAGGYLDATSKPVTESDNSISGGAASINNIPLISQVFSIYPNPVDKVFSMQINNNYTGAMNVQIVNLAGMIVKQYKLSKALPMSQVNLSVSELPTGTYFVKVQIGKWNDTRKLIKL